MPEKAKYALSESDQTAEMQVITACWSLLRKLDTNARRRALVWLETWVRAEEPENRDSLY